MYRPKVLPPLLRQLCYITVVLSGTVVGVVILYVALVHYGVLPYVE